MTIDELHLALLEWGRWAREGQPYCDPDLGYSCAISPIFKDWSPDQWWKDAGEDAPQGIEVTLETVPNDAECYALDKLVGCLVALYRHRLIERYVFGQWVDMLKLGEAQRALLDRMA